jgi:hypothetical protein
MSGTLAMSPTRQAIEYRLTTMAGPVMSKRDRQQTRDAINSQSMKQQRA